MRPAEMQILQGMGVSERHRHRPRRLPGDPRPGGLPPAHPRVPGGREVARLREGVEHARGELKRLRSRAEEDLGNDLAAIFDAHVLLLSDAKFLGRVEERIRAHQVNAEWAVHKTAEELDNRFSHMDDPYIRERSEDLTDVSRHLLRSLQGIAHHDLSELPADIVIVADDLTPSDAIRLGRERVIGFAIESGGRTSHTTIIARSLNIPAVAGLVGVMGMLQRRGADHRRRRDRPGHPASHCRGARASTGARKAEIERRDRDLLATRELAAVTRDGVEIQLMANIDLPEEVEEVPMLRRRRRRPLPQRVPLHREEPADADRGGARRDLPPPGRVRGAPPGDHPHLRPGRAQAGARDDGDAKRRTPCSGCAASA